MEIKDIYGKVIASGKDYKEIFKKTKHLFRADLSKANLSGANLSKANLCHADLSGANLSGADLNHTDLRGVDLRDADLSHANLFDADLNHTDLRNADLSGADLRNADLRYVDLRDADLSGVKYNECTSFFSLQCPEEGAFIGWKKAKSCIVKLQITENAKRSSATTRRCRCSEAIVLDITNAKGEHIKRVASNRDENFIYEVGKLVKVDDFNENRWDECSTGIHFFITKGEAENY